MVIVMELLFKEFRFFTIFFVPPKKEFCDFLAGNQLYDS